ncbi:MAG: hypothetical protein RMJ98_06100 [Myxococcales bacterium]|nr:hypothetical protein [Polyangiaceae bacterium]MDW8248861.1 hypothetical protein [Myxococcales bacterium]
MADGNDGKQPKKSKGESKSKATFVPKERRFLPVRDARLNAALGAGALGSMLLGAGVYIQFFRPENNVLAVKLGSRVVELADKGAYVVGAGAVILALVILFAPDFETALLVGDGGVGVDEGGDEGPQRILWCDMEQISLSGDVLIVRGDDRKFSVPLSSQPQAAAWIVREAQARIPSILSLDPTERERIPKMDEQAGEHRKITDIQIAGRRCRATDRVISYEPDARLCPRCGEIYLKDNVPGECLTCEGPLGDAAQQVSS